MGPKAGITMKNYLTIFLLLTMTTASAHGPVPARLSQPSDLIRTGLTDSDTTAGGTARLCERVTFSRGLRYGENEANVLDVATSEPKADTPRPVLLFVAGESPAEHLVHRGEVVQYARRLRRSRAIGGWGLGSGCQKIRFEDLHSRLLTASPQPPAPTPHRNPAQAGQ